MDVNNNEINTMFICKEDKNSRMIEKKAALAETGSKRLCSEGAYGTVQVHAAGLAAAA